MIIVSNEVPVIEIDGRDPSTPAGQKKPAVKVESHWSREGWVVLRWQDTVITMLAGDLMAAVANSINRGQG